MTFIMSCVCLQKSCHELTSSCSTHQFLVGPLVTGWVSWTNPGTHGSTCRGSAVPTTTWTKANCCRCRWRFAVGGACHLSRREFVQPEFWWDVVMQQRTNEHLKAQVSCDLFGFVRPRNSINCKLAERIWENHELARYIYIYTYIFCVTSSYYTIVSL